MKNKILEFVKNLLVGIIFSALLTLLGVFVCNTSLGIIILLIVLLFIFCYAVGYLIRILIKYYKEYKQE